MKKFIFSALMASALIFGSCAGNGGHGAKTAQSGGMDPKAMIEMMDDMMDLTDEQEKSMTHLFEEMNKEMSDLSKEERMAKMKEMNGKVMQLLDKEQQEIFKGFMKMHSMMGKK